MFWKAKQNAFLTHLKCNWIWIWLFWGKFEKVKLIPGTSGHFLRDVQGTHGRHFGETQWTHQPSTFSAFVTLLQPATRTCCTQPDVFTISYRLWSYKLKLCCSDDIYVTVQVYGVKNFQFFKQIMKSSYFTLTNCTFVVAYLSQMVCAGIVLRVFQFPLEPSPIHLHHHSMLWWKDCNCDIVRYHACESSGLLDRLPWRGQGIHVQQWSFKYEIINLNNIVFLSL